MLEIKKPMEIDDKSIDEDNKFEECINVYSKYNYNREIYANTEGYVIVEPGSKGAYMTRSITQSIVNDKIFFNHLIKL